MGFILKPTLYPTRFPSARSVDLVNLKIECIPLIVKIQKSKTTANREDNA